MYIFTISNNDNVDESNYTYHYYLNPFILNKWMNKNITNLIPNDRFLNLCVLRKYNSHIRSYEMKELDNLTILESTRIYNGTDYNDRVFREFINKHHSKIIKSLLLL